ncbi:MAG: DNA mismatch repair endonuclease MutL [Spirochaetes bacterium]|nr:DNA mismatch repair endonuclease MutL [Spirochaetota bacterium]
MDRIKLLPDSVKKKIAAGEVVEGPFSVIKELMENSIDAGASRVDVQVLEGGLRKIAVRDDGRGMYRDDVPLAVMEHATSKIGDIHDIESIGSYGFRGEALSSISSVSRLTILSRRADEESGARLTGTEDGFETADYAGPPGTAIIVENLFYNVPARKKFLKSVRTEQRLIRDIFLKIALPHPEIAFTLDVDEGRQLTLNSAGGIEERLGQIYGRGIMDDLYPVTLQDLKVTMSGFLSRPHYLRPNRAMQILYVNRRPVEHRYLGFLLSKAYEAVAPRGKHPAGIILIDIDPRLVDVNIHPAKKEVKLFDSHYIDRLILALGEKAVSREHSVGERLFAAGTAAQQLPPAIQGRASSGNDDQGNRPVEDLGGASMFGGGPSPTGKDRLFTPTPSSYIKDAADLYHDIEESKAPRIVGVAFGTYIILEKDGLLYFIDFHAAHERIIYDAMMEKKEAPEIQRLAFPQIMELSLDDHALVLENIDIFSENGFDIEDFSDNSIKISSVPAAARDSDAAELMTDFLESVRGEYRASDIREKMAATVACHAAKRAGDRLSVSDMEALVKGIFGAGRRLVCPHGRPFVYRMEKGDIERMFKRQ